MRKQEIPYTNRLSGLPTTVLPWPWKAAEALLTCSALIGGAMMLIGFIVVLAVGGLNYLDGGDRIVDLASLLQRKLPDFRILVAGC